jgi:hypothetical protein
MSDWKLAYKETLRGGEAITVFHDSANSLYATVGPGHLGVQLFALPHASAADIAGIVRSLHEA